MRPRHKAAENAHYTATTVGTRYASMRPRHKAAENLSNPGTHALNILGLQ